MDYDDAWQSVTDLEQQLRQLFSVQIGEDEVLRVRHPELAEQLDRTRGTGEGDLLQYTQIRDLVRLVEEEWGSGIAVVFSRKLATIKGDLHRIADLRNAPAHSRPQNYSERALTVGLCGAILDDLARHRSQTDPADDYYPVITSAIDRFGQASKSLIKTRSDRALVVGQEVSFDCAGRDVRGRMLFWKLSFAVSMLSEVVLDKKTGSHVTLSAIVPAQAVAGRRQLTVSMWVESDYHRKTKCDDSVAWWYEVRPPDFGPESANS